MIITNFFLSRNCQLENNSPVYTWQKENFITAKNILLQLLFHGTSFGYTRFALEFSSFFLKNKNRLQFKFLTIFLIDSVMHFFFIVSLSSNRKTINWTLCNISERIQFTYRAVSVSLFFFKCVFNNN